MGQKVGGFLLALLILAIMHHPTATASTPSKYSYTSRYKSVVSNSPLHNREYDEEIKKWSLIYTPQHPWYWNKAQLIAESALHPKAVSSVGAMGLGQFMPKTWEQMERELGWYASPFSTSHNIQASTYYMSTLIAQFKKDRPYADKYNLALASYNAGLGNILIAQRKGGNSLLYTPMASHLHLVTGASNSKQTKDYVNRIWEYILILEVIYNE